VSAVRALVAGASIAVFSLIVTLSCATVDESRPLLSAVAPERALYPHLVTVPVGSTPVFLGVAPRLRNADEESDAVLAAAALQASRWIRLSGEAAYYVRTTGATTSYLQSISIDDDFAFAASIEERLALVAETRDELGVWGLYTLSDGRVDGLALRTRDVAGRPTWLTSTPDINGYYVGVGAAARSRLVIDSIEAADREALFSVLSQIVVEVRSDRFERVVEGQGARSSATNLERARGTIAGFYVLDRWIDEAGTSYTLAVCPKSGNTE
jgi:hypothetical protein